jgi:hypothetical protein
MRRMRLAALTSIVTCVTISITAAAIPDKPRWESSAPHGTWNSGGFVINNNVWNRGAGPQRIWADSYRHWGVRSTQRLGNLRVKAFPCVQKLFHAAPVSSFRTIFNGFAESMPALTARRGAEAADDVWLNHRRLEVMIWVEDHGQTPSGSIIGHAKIFGQHFAVWHRGADYTFALNHNETRGVTHILAALHWLIRHGYLSRGATISQVNFGWEIAYTGGVPKHFTISKYWLTTGRR